ncbi:hypothetical protein LELG_03511 [Lodderomyces elongisporus NRRL YB-4239]|uniref:Uncharacterized protein n=1 Tax=Lodderomyces elongisporus (strain ATCC 11503 / CBS 2605 / JCM 1781 / NBRC 1676 / NRRL YB-4239) TaxID=379508 RepID=A5E1M4_LODEL|nr:hypothetical protein LELG_03511 [Lodderomyces elongisporus NRRL YB-4239]
MMVDPRDNKVNDDDLLSEDSSDEYNNLVKEFELRVQKLKEKERLKRQKQKQEEDQQRAQGQWKQHDDCETPRTEVYASPEKKKKNREEKGTKQIGTNINGIYNDEEEQIRAIKNRQQTKPSQFLSKLYDAKLANQLGKLQSIDYDRRKFQFDFTNLERASPMEVTNDLCWLSGHYLRRRYLTKDELKNLLQETDPELKLLKIDKLLAKTHKENGYAEPLYTNWALVAFVILKSDVLYTKQDKKYMKIKIGNFDHSIDLLLFDEGFERNWKMQQGDLILLLNPIINKYEIKVGEQNYKSGFNLRVEKTNPESILEIGSLRDFGLCQFRRRSDNQRCSNVINVTKQSLCDIHLDMKFKQSTRMELNGSVTMRSPTKNKTKIYMSTGNASSSKSISSSTNSTSKTARSRVPIGFIKEYNEDSSFTSSGMGKIDFRKFQDPKLLQTQMKRRKLMNDRANELLERKLSGISHNNSIVESLHLSRGTSSSRTSTNPDRRKDIPFSSSMISKLGFDPTNPESLHRQAPKPEKLQELYDLTLKTSAKKTLATSIEDKQAKMKHWKENLVNLKKYDSKLQQSSLNASQSITGMISKKTVASPERKQKLNRVVYDSDEERENRKVEAAKMEASLDDNASGDRCDSNDNDDFDDDDDDDLDIEFGGDDKKAIYASLIGGKLK